MEITAEQVALRAAEIVRAGWCQGKMSDGEGRFCAEAAGYEAAGLFHRMQEVDRVDDGPLGEALLAFEAWIDPDEYDDDCIWGWNDNADRTQQQVVDAWEATAITLRTQVSSCVSSV